MVLQEILTASFMWWALNSSVVAILSWLYVCQGCRGDRERWLIYLGIALSWTSAAILSISFVGSLNGVQSSYNIIMMLCCYIASIGALLHIRALSSRLELTFNIGKIWPFLPFATFIGSFFIF
jgi:hypothetical protein